LAFKVAIPTLDSRPIFCSFMLVIWLQMLFHWW